MVDFQQMAQAGVTQNLLAMLSLERSLRAVIVARLVRSELGTEALPQKEAETLLAAGQAAHARVQQLKKELRELGVTPPSR